MKFGKIELEEFEGMTKFTQELASAWSVVEDVVGAQYKPLLYLGKQVTKGTNYYFLAELKLILPEPERHVVLLAVNEFGGKCELVGTSIQVII